MFKFSPRLNAIQFNSVLRPPFLKEFAKNQLISRPHFFFFFFSIRAVEWYQTWFNTADEKFTHIILGMWVGTTLFDEELDSTKMLIGRCNNEGSVSNLRKRVVVRTTDFKSSEISVGNVCVCVLMTNFGFINKPTAFK
jgi:hypothetical protein